YGKTRSPRELQYSTNARPTIPPAPVTRIFNSRLPLRHTVYGNNLGKRRCEFVRSSRGSRGTTELSSAVRFPTFRAGAIPIPLQSGSDQSRSGDHARDDL